MLCVMHWKKEFNFYVAYFHGGIIMNTHMYNTFYAHTHLVWYRHHRHMYVYGTNIVRFFGIFHIN